MVFTVVAPVAETEAVLAMVPAEVSCHFTRYVPVSTQVAPSATVGQVMLLGVSIGSLTTTFDRVTLPALVAVTL